MHGIMVTVQYLDVTHVNRIGQTDATSGFDLVALIKISLRCNEWRKPNKNSISHIDHLSYAMYKTDNYHKNNW